VIAPSLNPRVRSHDHVISQNRPENGSSMM
jgi:hypothetical protein